MLISEQPPHCLERCLLVLSRATQVPLRVQRRDKVMSGCERRSSGVLS
jgi:hypothetical protein